MEVSYLNNTRQNLYMDVIIVILNIKIIYRGTQEACLPPVWLAHVEHLAVGLEVGVDPGKSCWPQLKPVSGTLV